MRESTHRLSPDAHILGHDERRGTGKERDTAGLLIRPLCPTPADRMGAAVQGPPLNPTAAEVVKENHDQFATVRGHAEAAYPGLAAVYAGNPPDLGGAVRLPRRDTLA